MLFQILPLPHWEVKTMSLHLEPEGTTSTNKDSTVVLLCKNAMPCFLKTNTLTIQLP